MSNTTHTPATPTNEYTLTADERSNAFALRQQIIDAKARAYDLREALEQAEKAVALAGAVYEGSISVLIATRCPGGRLTADLARIVKGA